MLTVTGLSKTYRRGERPALSDVSLTIGPGERVALLGPSGAGKSTLIRSICGLVTPDSGRVVVGDHEITALTGKGLQTARRDIALIFQEFQLIDRLPALTNVLIGRFGRYSFVQNLLGLWTAADRAQAQRLLERVGLGGQGAALARELSGGQRQRVAIARAMMQEPLLLLGDEPVASLDPVNAASVLSLIGELAADTGMTTVLSLHAVELARIFCDRAIGINGGRVVYDGPIQQLSARTLDEIYQTRSTPEERKINPLGLRD